MRIGTFFEKVLKMPWVMLWGGLFFVFNCCETRNWLPLIGGMQERLRAFFLRLLGAKLASGARVRSRAYITRPKHLKMGINSRIANGCRLYLHDKFILGDNVHIGAGLTVQTSDHRIDNPEKPLVDQGMKLGTVIVEDDVYMGVNVTLLAGVTIHSRVVVGAGSVVTKDLEGGWVYGGVPAKPIRRLEAGDSVLG